MTIKGLGNGGVPSPDARRTDGTAGSRRLGTAGQVDGSRASGRLETSADADVLDLSADALTSRATTDLPPRGSLPAARLQQIAARLADGSYDQPAVQDVVLDRLAPHLDTLGESTG